MIIRLRMKSQHRWIAVGKWLLPAVMILFVAVYEIGPGRWIQTSLGFMTHVLADILIFGTLGPILTFISLDFLDRWIAERETADLLGQFLDRANEDLEDSRRLSDDAIQVLFSAHIMLESIRTNTPGMPRETASQLEDTDEALGQAIIQLRSHLLNQSDKPK